jgi:hypothetical protein
MSSPSQPPAGSPLAWLLLTNALFWGGLFGGEALLSELASRRQESPTANPGALPNGKLAELLQPNPWRQAGPPAPGQATPAVPTTLLPGSPAPGVPRFQPQFATAASSEAGLSPLARQLQGADALGGEITLASLGEPRMLPAARAERLNWQRSGNPLSPLPLHWQNRLRQETAGGPPIQRADLVRVPVAQLQQREEVAVLIDEEGTAQSLNLPLQQPVREAVEQWATRQQPADPGGLHAVVIAAEPLPEAVSKAVRVAVAVPQAAPQPVTQPVTQPQPAPLMSESVPATVEPGL